MHTISFECAIKINTTYIETASACARVGTTGVLFPRLGNPFGVVVDFNCFHSSAKDEI